MEFETALKEELSTIEKRKEKLMDLLNVYGSPSNGVNPTASKTDQYKHVIRDLLKKPKAFHITDFEAHFDSKGFEFNKGLIHQVLSSLRESGECIAVRINRSNQRYFYMHPKAKQGEGIKDDYLPMPKRYVESIELM